MEKKKLKIQMNGRSDEFGTPKEALEILLPYLKKDWTIWECAWGKGTLAKHLRENGFEVIGESFKDFLNKDLGLNKEGFNCIVTNPPYSKKEEFLERCFEIGKPFALLMPLTALEGKKRGELYRKYGISLIIPNKRFNFETPSGEDHTTHKITFLGMPPQINKCLDGLAWSFQLESGDYYKPIMQS